jgi:MarR family transcriptional regulator, lower aerobic nicotinate degradation pathway regulator
MTGDQAPLPRSQWAFPTPPRPWSLAMGDDCAFMLSKIGARANKLFARALEPLGLRPNHVSVLNYLRAAEGASQRELVDGLWIDASSMVALLDEFEARGLAERRPREGDRRAYAVFLTDDGRAMLEQALALSREVEERLLAPLEADDRARLQRILVAIAGGGDAGAPPNGSR